MDERQKSIVRQSSMKSAVDLMKIICAESNRVLDVDGVWPLTAVLANKIEAWVNRP